MNPSRFAPLAASFALSAVLLVAVPAQAAGVAPEDASSAQKTEAMSHFSAGKAAIEQSNWEKATLELRASLDVVNSPNARLVLARALRDSGDWADAWTEFSHTIDDATKLAVREARYAKTAEVAAAERADLEPKLAFVVVNLAHVPADATLKAAGRSVPADDWARPILVPAGTVDVVLSDAGGNELARQTVSATLGQKTAVLLDAQSPLPPPLPPPPPVAQRTEVKEHVERRPLPESATPSADSSLRSYAYVAGGIGVAGFALFTVFGLMDNSTYNDLKSSCTHDVCPPSKQSDVSSGRAQQTVANVSLLVGAVGVATGATLFVLSVSSKPSSGNGTGLVVAPGYIGWRGSL